MASVAVELHRAGFAVSGSDSAFYPPMGDFLRREGLKTFAGYDPDNLPDNGLTVIGNAISRGNPELEAVLNARLPYISLPELISRRYLSHRKSIVIAGTHGKTTTTAMTAHILRSNGRDPGWMIGGMPVDLPFPCNMGSGNEFVIEGDEYDSVYYDKRAKFLHYQPNHAVLSGIEFDHADIFPDIEAIETTFTRFVRLIPANGSLTVNQDNDLAGRVASKALCRVITCGSGPDCQWRLDYESRVVKAIDNSRHKLTLRLPGKHNYMNALTAVALAYQIGVSIDDSIEALADFRGVGRRLEKVIETDKIVLYDDFAHHPTEIRASIQAIKEHYPGWRIWAVIEPRSNTLVRNIFERELAEALSNADVALLGSLHRKDRIPMESRLNREHVVDTISQNGNLATAADDASSIVEFVRKNASEKDVIILMSNGNFGGLRGLLEDFINNPHSIN